MLNTEDRKPVALLVEDDQDTSDIYSVFLSRAGFDVLVTPSAEEAFRAAVAHRPGVIIADVRLPGNADGITLTAKLRLDARTTHTPIILVTADGLRSARERGLAAGCDVFLTKPCAPDLLADHARSLATPRSVLKGV